MKDNLSIVITMIVLVLLLIIFPLYNYFERQDDMSYNLVLKATAVFADEVMNAGYLDQNMFDNFVTQLANTGNLYDIQLEAHRRIITNDPKNPNQKMDQYVIDYNKDIFDENGKPTSNVNGKILKNDIYKFNEGDKFYVKVKNTSTTMAGAIFNTIVPTSSKERITANYGGMIKNVSWKPVDATYLDIYNPNINKPTISLIYPNDLKIVENKLTITSNTSTGYNKRLTFKAEGPNNVTWWNKIDYYIWQVDNNPEVKLPVNQYFNINSLSYGTHTLKVMGYNSVIGDYTEQASITIQVERKVQTIRAELGWDPDWDLDLSVYFKHKSGTVEKVYYGNLNTSYGTLSGDDRSGSGSGVDEYIDFKLDNINNNDIIEMSIYVNNYDGSTLRSVNNLFTRIIIGYGDENKIVSNTNIENKTAANSQTIRIGVLKKVANGDWYLESDTLVPTTLP